MRSCFTSGLGYKYRVTRNLRPRTFNIAIHVREVDIIALVSQAQEPWAQYEPSTERSFKLIEDGALGPL